MKTRQQVRFTKQTYKSNHAANLQWNRYKLETPVRQTNVNRAGDPWNDVEIKHYGISGDKKTRTDLLRQLLLRSRANWAQFFAHVSIAPRRLCTPKPSKIWRINARWWWIREKGTPGRRTSLTDMWDRVPFLIHLMSSTRMKHTPPPNHASPRVIVSCYHASNHESQKWSFLLNC